jgi:hypothetical protein
VTWINEHKSKLRIAFLLLLVIAINGPWLAFDAMWVPSEPPFECRPPNTRLSDNLCGEVKSLTRLMFEGAMDASLLYSWVLFPTLLPLFSSLVIILRGEHKRLKILHFVLLALAAAYSAILIFTPEMLRVSIWGIWLYFILVLLMLVIEGLTTIIDRRHALQSV